MSRKNQTRRQFILSAGTTGLVTLAALPAMTMGNFLNFNSQPKHGLIIGLSMYSLRSLFRDNKLDVLSYPRFAKETFGIEHIDTWEGGMPEDKREDPAFYHKIKEAADEAGSDIFLHMAGAVDATGKTEKDRREQAEKFFPPADRAAILGCQFLRVFLRAPEIAPEEAIKRCAETLYPLAEYTREKKLSLAIEPGASDLGQSGEFLAHLMEELQHPNCVLMPDFGKYGGRDVYENTRAMMPYSAVVSAKTHDFDKEGNQIDFNYFKLMNIIVDSGFKGIVAIEYEGTNLPPVEGVTATKTLINKSLSKI